MIEVATVDHGLRPESADEVAFVARHAAQRGLRCHEVRLRLEGGAGLEARARDARYAALERVRAARGLDAIVTAHTASDQAETVLMRLSRGSALAGAAAIRERRGKVVRPLLGCTREEVRAYLARRSVVAIEDPMNRDRAFLRVRIRTDVLPALEQAAGPGVAFRLASFATWAGEDAALLDEWAAAAHQRLRLPEGGVDRVGLLALPPPLARRVLVRLAAEADLPINAEVVDRMERAVLEEGNATLPRHATLRAASGVVRIDAAKVGPREVGVGALLQLDAEPVSLPEAGVWVAWRSIPADAQAQAVSQPLHVDPAGGPLTLRFRASGDRVQLANGRTRKLQDVLTDAGVPRERRNLVPVALAPTGAVIAVVGVWPRPGTRARPAASWLISGHLAGDPGARSPGAL